MPVIVKMRRSETYLKRVPLLEVPMGAEIAESLFGDAAEDPEKLMTFISVSPGEATRFATEEEALKLFDEDDHESIVLIHCD